MGSDKALLPLEGRALAQHVADVVASVANPVCLVGAHAAYGMLGLPTIADAISDRGPLSGIETALLSPFAAEWNLIVACDMPRLNPGLLRELVETTEPGIDCVVPRTASGKLEPLCAIYKRSCGPLITRALSNGNRRVVDVVAMLQAKFWPVHDAGPFQNVNTALEWDQFLNDR